MERNTKTWLSGGVDQVDETMQNHSILLGASEWKAARGVDPAPTWRPAGMSPSAPSVYISSGHSSVLHDKALLKGINITIPGVKTPRRYPLAIVCRQYHLLHPGLRAGGSLPPHHDGNILQFLRSLPEMSQIHIRGIRIISGRDDYMCMHSGDADSHTTHLVLGCAIDREAAPSSRMATGARHGGCTIKGLASAASFARRSPSSGEGGPLRHSDLLHVSISNACKDATTPGRGNSAVLLTQSGASGDESRSTCRLAYGVSAYIPGRARDMSHPAHQHSPPSQVGVPCDADIGGPPLAGDQRGIRALHELG